MYLPSFPADLDSVRWVLLFCKIEFKGTRAQHVWLEITYLKYNLDMSLSEEMWFWMSDSSFENSWNILKSYIQQGNFKIYIVCDRKVYL